MEKKTCHGHWKQIESEWTKRIFIDFFNIEKNSEGFPNSTIYQSILYAFTGFNLCSGLSRGGE